MAGADLVPCSCLIQPRIYKSTFFTGFGFGENDIWDIEYFEEVPNASTVDKIS